MAPVDSTVEATRARHPSARPAPARPRRPPTSPGPVPPLNVILLVGTVVGLLVIGLIWVLSASEVAQVRSNRSPWIYFERQLLWIALGTAAMAVGYRVDYRRWRRIAPGLLALAIVLLVLVLVPGLGISVSGSTRWIGVGSWRMQPAELAKLAVLLFSADVLSRRTGTGLPVLPPVLTMFVVVGALIMLQPDMGTMLVVMAVVLAVLFVGGTTLRHLAAIVTCGGGAAIILGLVAPYRRARLLSFMHPFRDASNTGYQVVQGYVGMGSGGLWGIGIGASRAKWGFLPNAHTDFIFAIIAEEAGLIGSMLVVGLFVAFGVLGVRIARRAPDRFGLLLGIGITAWVVAQAFINIGAVIGLLPVTGVPLPLVSFGGSSLMIVMGAIGVLLNVGRQARPRRRT